MAELPSFILHILEKELYDIQSALLEKVANEYRLEHSELVSRFLKDPIRVVPNAHTKIEITRKVEQKPPPSDEERCRARIWNRGNGGQCTRKKQSEDSDLCSHHSKMEEKDGKLRHGRITEPPPYGIFTRCRKKVVYK
jgi:hypothetical protein